MNKPEKISLKNFDELYSARYLNMKPKPFYLSPLGKYVSEGDYRLKHLKFDNSYASFLLWNFLLSEEERLYRARKKGKKIIGTMKDLGTIPVMIYSIPGFIAFYPDGAWWIPCIMEMSDNLFAVADENGADDSFCPVRAMIGAFKTKNHFPIPDMLISSIGATCDDFRVVAQKVENLGNKILWWEIPHRRNPEYNEKSAALPGGFRAPLSQIRFVKNEILRIKKIIEKEFKIKITGDMVSKGIKKANRVRNLLEKIRFLAYTSEICPFPALEMQIVEMLAIHFCSDMDECIRILKIILEEIKVRIGKGINVLKKNAVKIFWINPVADLRMMNILEDCGGRLCGTDFMFSHALDLIPEDIEPFEGLAMMAMSDPMTGCSADRSERIISDITKYGADAVIVSKIPGASHCASESIIIHRYIRERLNIPIAEVEVPTLCDSYDQSIETRISALIESAR